MASAVSVKAQLAELSCPFTWDLAEIARLYSCVQRENRQYDQMDEDVPLLQCIISLVRCFESVISADMASAKAKLQEAMSILTDIREKKSMLNIEKAIDHIYYATECYLLYETEDGSLKLVLERIPTISSFNDEELGALEGCKSIAYSMYHTFGVEKAIAAATTAIQKDESNALWFFMLANNMRRGRRAKTSFIPASDLEKKYYEKAYSMSKIPLYIIYYIQSLQEILSHDIRKCSKEEATFLKDNAGVQFLNMYKAIVNTNTRNYKVLLKIALGAMKHGRNGVLLAITCLNIVDELSPRNSVSIHYRAIALEKLNKHKEASICFERAIEQQNFCAEMTYIFYCWKISKVDPTNRLFAMLSKYENEHQIQQILLAIGTWYHMSGKNQMDSAKYLLKGIKIDPSSEILTNYYQFLNFRVTNYKSSNIYDFVHKMVLPPLKFALRRNRSLEDVYQQLKTVCDDHVEQKLELSEKLTRQLKL